MSIVVKKKDQQEVPSNYVKCSKAEALEHQWKLISDWRPKSDIWPFRQGPAFLGVAAAISGGVIASRLRVKLNLRHFGRTAMLLPVMGVPGTFGPLLNLTLVGEPVMLQSECPVCLQMRAMLLQNLIGVGYPIIMASATGLFVAERYATFRLPEFTMRAIPQFINIAKNLLIPSKNTLYGLVIINSLLAGFVTDRQANTIFTITQKLEEEDPDDHLQP